MPARLVVVSGPDRGRVLAIPPEGGLVGRGETCSMRLGDSAVSREHFRIGVRDGRPLVIDLGSTNRTRVNGEPVDRRALTPGDRIEIGKSVLEMVGDGDVVCTGAGTAVVIDQEAAQIARAIGQHTADPAVLVVAMNTLSTLAEALPAAPSASAAAEIAVTVVGATLGASRIQLLRDSDGDRGQGYAVVAGRSDDVEAPVGAVALERAILVNVAEQGRAVTAVDGDRVAALAPLKIEGVPCVLIADRVGAPWELAAVGLLAAAARAIGASLDAHVGRDRVARERGGDAIEIDGDSAVAARLREWVTWLAQRTEPVILLGEPGAGKERVAQAIHGRSARAIGPFVAVRCAATSESWLESKLFGQETPGSERRPGRIEEARGGTLFLDELAALPARCQKRLARTLAQGYLEKSTGGHIPIDVRIICSSCRDVAAMVPAGTMREDLYPRLAGHVVVLAPLRERRPDIVAMAERFLYQLAAEAGQRRTGFSADAATRLAQHDWPGNLRELRNVVERLIVQGGDDPLTARDVERAMFPPRPA
jgi:Sigma-54 interaction domain/Inner membrane component of T3SS, cytoplasmic domain